MDSGWKVEDIAITHSDKYITNPLKALQIHGLQHTTLLTTLPLSHPTRSCL